MHYYRYSNAKVSCWYKYLLFSYNIIFWLAGVVFLGVGLWAWSEKGVLSDLTKVTRLHGIDPVVLVLMVGVVMFTLGFAGCVGALRENICLLKFFCGAIVLIFFLELAVAVLAFLFQDWVRDRFREFFESNIRSYRDDIDLQNLIDSLQKAVSSTSSGLPARAWAFLPASVQCCPRAEASGGQEQLPPLGVLLAAWQAAGRPRRGHLCLWSVQLCLLVAAQQSRLPQGPLPTWDWAGRSSWQGCSCTRGHPLQVLSPPLLPKGAQISPALPGSHSGCSPPWDLGRWVPWVEFIPPGS
ncbi:tetraspanin-14 isoform X3 [Microcebus murinus]